MAGTTEVLFDERNLFLESCRPMYWYNTITFERVPYYCNSPKCFRPGCLEHWSRKRLAICNDLISRYGLTRFFTLTVDRSMQPAEAWKMISTWWESFRHKVKGWLRKLGRPALKFIAVLEAHKDGYPHIHGFWNIYIPQNILADIWAECAPGEIVHVEQVKDSKSASEYLGTEMGKYLGKEQSVNGARMAGHRKRSFWRSKGLYTKFELDKREKVRDTEWTLVKEFKNAKEKWQGDDMEAACQPLPEESIGAGQPKLETQARKSVTGEENQVPAGTEGQGQCRDSQTQGELDYGYETERYESNSRCAKSSGACVPDNAVQSEVGSYGGSRGQQRERSA